MHTATNTVSLLTILGILLSQTGKPTDFSNSKFHLPALFIYWKLIHLLPALIDCINYFPKLFTHNTIFSAKLGTILYIYNYICKCSFGGFFKNDFFLRLILMLTHFFIDTVYANIILYSKCVVL